MKRWLVLFFLTVPALAQIPNIQSGMLGLDLNGNWRYLKIDSSGNVVTAGTPTTGPTTNAAYPSEYSAMIGRDVNGNWQYLKLDANGYLLVSGGGGGSGVSSINGNTGAFTFTGSGVSCSGTTCTFAGGGGTQVSGVRYGNGASADSAATSPQLVSALNATPSTTFAMSLIPTLNQNTTGTAANVTGLVATANGGTGSTGVTGIRQGNGSSPDSAATAITGLPITAPSVTTSGTTSGISSMVAGTGNEAALPANSGGFVAPATGGTSYVFKLPQAAVAGIWFSAAGATNEGVNEGALSLLTPGASGTVLTSTGATSAPTWQTGGGAVTHYYTSTTYTGIGPVAFTPTHTLDIDDATASTGNTTLYITAGAGQTSDLLDIYSSSAAKLFSVSQYGALTITNVTTFSGTSTLGLGFPITYANTSALATGHTAAYGTAGAPNVLFGTRTYVGNLLQTFHVSCYMNTSVAATGTVSLFLTWTDNVGAKTSSAFTMNTAATATGFANIGPITIAATASGNTSTNIGYYTTVTGSGYTYGVTCNVQEID